MLVCIGSEGCVFLPRSSGTLVATWTSPTWVVSRRRVLEAVFVLLEYLSPSRRLFIGSHSLPPSLVCRISPSVERCFLAGSSSELWKWHRKLGHFGFDLLSRLSKLNLVRGLPRLRLEKELVCAPCRHAKMVASSHPPFTVVMTERPCELVHMDLVGPARV
jgi:hypothetical protein